MLGGGYEDFCGGLEDDGGFAVLQWLVRANDDWMREASAACSLLLIGSSSINATSLELAIL